MDYIQQFGYNRSRSEATYKALITSAVAKAVHSISSVGKPLPKPLPIQNYYVKMVSKHFRKNLGS